MCSGRSAAENPERKCSTRCVCAIRYQGHCHCLLEQRLSPEQRPQSRGRGARRAIDHAVSAAELELVNASFYLPWGTAPPTGHTNTPNPVQTRADGGQTMLTACLDEVREGGEVRVPCWEVMLSDGWR